MSKDDSHRLNLPSHEVFSEVINTLFYVRSQYLLRMAFKGGQVATMLLGTSLCIVAKNSISDSTVRPYPYKVHTPPSPWVGLFAVAVRIGERA